MCPKLESDDENFFKIEGIIEIKNDRKLQDKFELNEKLFGLYTTHKLEEKFKFATIDEKEKLKTYFIAGGKSNDF